MILEPISYKKDGGEFKKKINARSTGKHGLSMLSTNTKIMINKAVLFFNHYQIENIII